MPKIYQKNLEMSEKPWRSLETSKKSPETSKISPKTSNKSPEISKNLQKPLEMSRNL